MVGLRLESQLLGVRATEIIVLAGEYSDSQKCQKSHLGEFQEQKMFAKIFFQVRVNKPWLHKGKISFS